MIEILFFASLRDSVGKSKITLQADQMTIKQLKEILLETYDLPNLSQTMIAINEEYASDDSVINKGDIVAFIPPVSGG